MITKQFEGIKVIVKAEGEDDFSWETVFTDAIERTGAYDMHFRIEDGQPVLEIDAVDKSEDEES